MEKREISFGKSVGSWHSERAQTVTFIVTDDCNLRCKYCYITHKASDNVMTFETAKKFVEILLTTDQVKYDDSVILEFIGGEPMLEADLIDKIVDYFKIRAFELNHEWYWKYRISICTNGVNYSSPQVQKIINKNIDKISITITLDGPKEKHDMQRVFLDGKGSFDVVNSNIDLWLSQFEGMTKVTFASDDLPLLFESIKYLWNRGIKKVNANVVFENVWRDGDDKILEYQLEKLADYVIENNLFDEGYQCSFFDATIGFPYSEEDKNRTYCGAGKMIALSPNGTLFPCIRYYGFSLNNHDEWPIGDVDNGINYEKVRPFILATNKTQSSIECLNCKVATGCGFCQGFNYDNSFSGTNFDRATYNCKMHKARVRANEYFYSKLLNTRGINARALDQVFGNLHFLMDDSFTTYCSYRNAKAIPTHSMDLETINKGLAYARNSHFYPVLVHSAYSKLIEKEEYSEYLFDQLIPFSRVNEVDSNKIINWHPIFESNDISVCDNFYDICILNINDNDVSKLASNIKALFSKVNRINLNYIGITSDFNHLEYIHQLLNIADFIKSAWLLENRKIELNILTDDHFLTEKENCGAGEKSYVLAPEGNLYSCCASYSKDVGKKNSIGNLVFGLVNHVDSRIFALENNNLCGTCEVNHCKVCIDINKQFTNEYSVSPSFQCIKGNIEKEISEAMFEQINACNLESLKALSFTQCDPIEQIILNSNFISGYYKRIL